MCNLRSMLRPLLVFAVMALATTNFTIAETKGSKAGALRTLRNAPVRFEPNQGQVDANVKYLARGLGYGVFLTSHQAMLTFHQGPQDKAQAFTLTLQNTSSQSEIVGENALPSRSNYFIGSNQKSWHTGVPNYERVRYAEVYPGIDLIYYGSEQQLEYDFVISPGSSPKSVVIKIDGASGLHLDHSGNLILSGAAGDVQFHKPTSYQGSGKDKRQVESRYVLLAGNKVGFEVSGYDPKKELVIDPVLDYSTFIGGKSDDDAYDMAVDASGALYFTGTTSSTDYPTTAGAFDRTNYLDDICITKLSPDGSSLVYSTYLGGRTGAAGVFSVGTGIVVDSTGAAYVAGGTQNFDFPITPGGFNKIYDGVGAEGFLTKLSPDGSSLIYSTYLSGSTTGANDVAVDAAGNAYVTGNVVGTNFPATAGAFDTTFNGSYDAYVMVLNPSGSALVYATFLGGSDAEFGNALALNSTGELYVTGQTYSTNFPTTAGAYDTVLSGVNDAFVVKLNPTGSALVYSTLLGGTDGENGADILVTAAGHAVITGWTLSSNYPTTPGALQTTFKGGFGDAIVAEFDSNGASLLTSTYLGGSDYDVGQAVLLDPAGNYLVAVASSSPELPHVDSLFGFVGGSCGSGTFVCNDVYLAKLTPNAGSILFSTFLGGKGSDQPYAIGLGGDGALYVAGLTSSPDFPTTSAAFDKTCGSDGNCNGFGTFNGPVNDAFAAKITLDQVGGATAVLNPTALTFGPQTVGTTSKAKLITLTNTGTLDLAITSITLKGDFLQRNTCGSSLAAGSSCTISVAFRPRATGVRNGRLTVVDTAPDSPQTVSLTGTGK